jgi:hypothetical protein
MSSIITIQTIESLSHIEVDALFVQVRDTITEEEKKLRQSEVSLLEDEYSQEIEIIRRETETFQLS